MVKILFISFLVFFIIYKLFRFFFRMLLRSSINYQQQQQRTNGHTKRPSDGNVNIDYVPKDVKQDKKDFNGGEYIEYEEVK